jgi:hypothetical protein
MLSNAVFRNTTICEGCSYARRILILTSKRSSQLRVLEIGLGTNNPDMLSNPAQGENQVGGRRVNASLQAQRPNFAVQAMKRRFSNCIGVL